MSKFLKQALEWDTRLFLRAFESLAERKSWRRFFFGFSRSADGVWYLLAALAWEALAPERARVYLPAAAAAFILELCLYSLLKKGIKRPRPYRKIPGTTNWIVPPDEFSFPSGHTACAFLSALVLSTALPVLAIPAYLWALLVGFSRVALGVHYPGDVLAGMVLGSVCAGIGMMLI